MYRAMLYSWLLGLTTSGVHKGSRDLVSDARQRQGRAGADRLSEKRQDTYKETQTEEAAPGGHEQQGLAATASTSARSVRTYAAQPSRAAGEARPNAKCHDLANEMR